MRPLLLLLLLSSCASTDDRTYAMGTPYDSAPDAEAKSQVEVVSESATDFNMLESFGALLNAPATAERASPRMLARAAATPPVPTSTLDASSVPAVVKAEQSAKRLVIYRGDVAVLVGSVDDAAARFLSQVEALGGYLQNRADATITVRLPAARFFEVTKGLSSFGKLLRESIQADDVSKRVFDLELRLETATASRARLVKLLDQAQKMEDILRIETEIRRLTDEIEGMKGELRFLHDQVSMSTLTVHFQASAPPPSPYPSRVPSRFGWINQVGVERVENEF